MRYDVIIPDKAQEINMTTTKPARILPALLAATAFAGITHPAWAGGAPRSLEDYAKIAGEAGTARMNCNYEIDFRAMQKLGAPFTLNPADTPAAEKAMDVIAGALNTAGARYQDEGEAFCASALAAYGPAGSVAPGLLSKRAE